MIEIVCAIVGFRDLFRRQALQDGGEESTKGEPERGFATRHLVEAIHRDDAHFAALEGFHDLRQNSGVGHAAGSGDRNPRKGWLNKCLTLEHTVVFPDAVPPVQPMTKGRFRVFNSSSNSASAGGSRLIGLMSPSSLPPSWNGGGAAPTGECCSSMPSDEAELSATPPVGERGGLSEALPPRGGLVGIETLGLTDMSRLRTKRQLQHQRVSVALNLV